jgi:hypothetical protein
MINLNKLNNQQLEDRIYFIQREMQYDYGYMRASTVNKKMDEILKIRRILKERQRNNAN